MLALRLLVIAWPEIEAICTNDESDDLVEQVLLLYSIISVRTSPEWTTETHTLLNNRGVLYLLSKVYPR